jgi:hypothetical protein
LTDWNISYHHTTFTAKLNNSTKTQTDMSAYWVTVWWLIGGTMLDTLVLICVVPIICTGWRIRHTNRQLLSIPHDSQDGERRLLVAVQSLASLLDIIPFALGSLCFVTHRSAGLRRELAAAPSVDYWRWIFFCEFVDLLLDLILCGIPLLCIALAPWRYGTLYNNWTHPGGNDWSRRGLVATCALIALIDWPTFAVAIPVHLSIYRGIRLHKSIQSLPPTFFKREQLCADDMFQIHGAIWSEFLGLLIDIPCALLAVPVLVTGWRTAEFCRDFKNLAPPLNVINERRWMCMYHFGNLLVDLPFMVLCVVVAVGSVFYRLPGMGKEMQACRRVNDYRWVILMQFLNLLADIPFWMLAIVLLPMVWRSPLYLAESWRAQNACQRRWLTLENFGLALCDVPCAAMALVLWLTHYRWPGLQLRMTAGRGPWQMFDAANYTTGNRFEVHGEVFMEFLQLLVDIPCSLAGLLVVCLIYRVPTLWREFWVLPDACGRRILCWQQLGKLILDLPFILLGAIAGSLSLFASFGCRTWWFSRDVYGLNDAVSRRWCALHHTVLLLMDILTWPCAIVVSYRWPATLSTLQEEPTAGFGRPYNVMEPFLCEEAAKPHISIWKAVFAVVADVPFMPFFFICLLTVWRFPALMRDWHLYAAQRVRPERIDWARRLSCLYHSICLIIDVATLAMTLVMTLTGIRTYHLWSKLLKSNRSCHRPKLRTPPPTFTGLDHSPQIPPPPNHSPQIPLPETLLPHLVSSQTAPLAQSPIQSQIQSPISSPVGILTIRSAPNTPKSTMRGSGGGGGGGSLRFANDAPMLSAADLAPPLPPLRALQSPPNMSLSLRANKSVPLPPPNLPPPSLYLGALPPTTTTTTDKAATHSHKDEKQSMIEPWSAPVEQEAEAPWAQDAQGMDDIEVSEEWSCYYCGSHDVQVYEIVWTQFLQWVLDVLVLPFFMLCMPCIWRSPILFAELSRSSFDANGQRRLAILRHTGLLAIDALMLPFATITLVGLWRLPILKDKLSTLFTNLPATTPILAPTNNLLTSAAAAENNHKSGHVAIAMPPATPTAAALAGGSKWNGWFTRYEELMDGMHGWELQVSVVAEGLYTLAESIFCVFLWILLCIPWRHLTVRRKIWWNMAITNRHERLVLQALLLLLDLPLLVFGVCLLVTWRSHQLVSSLRSVDWEVVGAPHMVVMHQIGQFILDLPFVLMTLFLTPFIHRWNNLTNIILWGSDTHAQKRCAIWQQFKLAWCFDTTCAILTLILCLLPWRIAHFHRKRTRLLLLRNQPPHVPPLATPLSLAPPLPPKVVTTPTTPTTVYGSFDPHQWPSGHQLPAGLNDPPVLPPVLPPLLPPLPPPAPPPPALATVTVTVTVAVDASLWKSVFGVDDWHVLVLWEFGGWLVDVPFVLLWLIMGGGPVVAGWLLVDKFVAILGPHANMVEIVGIFMLAVFLFVPWRAGLSVPDLVIHTTTANQKRNAVIKHFVAFWLDHTAIVCRLLILITIWRQPLVSHTLNTTTRGWFRAYSEQESVAQFLDAHWIVLSTVMPEMVLDLLCVLPGLMLMLTVWRAKQYYTHMTAVDDSSTRRWITIQHTFELLLDTPFLILAAIVTIAGLLYRSIPLWRDVLAEPTLTKRRWVILHHFGQMCLDVPFFLAGFVLVGYPVGLYFFIRWLATGVSQTWLFVLVAALSALYPVRLWRTTQDVWQETVAKDRRLAVAEQLGLGLLDPFVLVSGVTIGLIGYYRLLLASFECQPYPGFFAPYRKQNEDGSGCARFECHGMIFHHFLQLFLDIPCWIMAGIVAITGWRTSAFFYDIAITQHQNPNNQDQNNQDNRNNNNGFTTGGFGVEHYRSCAVYHYLHLIVDIPFVVIATVVSCTFYRTPNILAIYSQHKFEPNRRRWPIMMQLVNTLADLPYIVLGVASLWRILSLVRDVRLTTTDKQRRRAALENFILMVLDVLCIGPLAVLMVFGFYRMRGTNGLWADLTKPGCTLFESIVPLYERDRCHVCCHGDIPWRRFTAHGEILSEFIEWIADLPYIFFGLVILVTGWRAPSLLAQIFPDVEFSACFQSICTRRIPPEEIVANRLAILRGDFSKARELNKDFGDPNKSFSGVPLVIKQYMVWPYLSDQELRGVARVSLEWKGLSVQEAKKRPPIARPRLFGSPAVTAKTFRTICCHEFIQWFIDVLVLPFAILTLHRFPLWIRDMKLCNRNNRNNSNNRNNNNNNNNSNTNNNNNTNRLVNAGWRRIATMQQFCKTMLDMISLVPALLLTVTGYRRMDVWDERYRREWFYPLDGTPCASRFKYYGIIWWSFFNLLFDLLFLIMGLMASCTLYRGYFIAKAINDLSEGEVRENNLHRGIILYHFLMFVPDIVCAPLLALVLVTIIRLPVLYARRKLPDANTSGMLHLDILRCTVLLLLDLLMLIPTALITLLVQRICPAIRKICLISSLRSGVVSRPLTEKQSSQLLSLHAEGESLVTNADGCKAWLSPTCYYPLIWVELWISIKRLPNIILYPLRCIAYFFIPFHWYILKRLGVRGADIRQCTTQALDSDVTISYLFRGIVWLQMHEPSYAEFARLERFLVVNLLSLPLLVLNEIGVILMAVHALVIFVLSFGITGQATSPEGRLRVGQCTYRLARTAQAVQGLLIVALLFAEVNLWFAPLYAASLAMKEVWNGDVPVVRLWEPRWHAPLVWCLWILFLVSESAALHMTARLCQQVYSIFRPLEFWRRLVPLKAYSSLLAFVTQQCHHLARGGYGCCARAVGELLLLAFTFVWIFWPSVVVIVYKAWLYLILTGAFNVATLFWSVNIVRKHWSNNPPPPHSPSSITQKTPLPSPSQPLPSQPAKFSAVQPLVVDDGIT